MGNIHAGKKGKKVYADPGVYVGYTKGEGVQQPTLYFEHGRLTQEHKKAGNIGWHPIVGGSYQKRQNISKADMDEYINADDKGLNSDREKFLDDFMKEKEGEETVVVGSNARLLECTSLFSGKYSTHRSRGKLIRVGDPGFNNNYNEDYAMPRAKKALAK